LFPRAGGDKQVLTQAVVQGKFLLVLDDIWSNEPWTGILQDPAVKAARTHPGSRVIITTRYEGLVKDMGTGSTMSNQWMMTMLGPCSRNSLWW
jgi:hypothetical protein